ncbi:MAG TPA: DUF2125 domain-containing protein [Caulobacteraceae bacterium]
MVLAIALIGWVGAWLWIKGRIERELDVTSARVKAAGGELNWSGRRVSGYPFRFDVDFTGLTWRGPDGWGVSAPEIRSEASVFAFGHWVAYAPEGISLVRPTGGAVRIAAQVLRASVSNDNRWPPTFSLEGRDLTFTPVTGATPYLLASARQLHIHTLAGPADQGAFLIELDDARASPESKLAAVSNGAAVNLEAEAIYDHADAMGGPGWTSAIRSWAMAGGKIQVRRLRFQAGAIEVDGRGSGFSVDPGGRLIGELALAHGEAALAALGGSAGSGRGAAVLSFRAGHMTLGPLALGRSPKVY